MRALKIYLWGVPIIALCLMVYWQQIYINQLKREVTVLNGIIASQVKEIKQAKGSPQPRKDALP